MVGLALARLLDAIAAAEDGCDVRVDVVRIDTLPAAFADAIRLGGVVLWPR